jgi:hypothetical protein
MLLAKDWVGFGLQFSLISIQLAIWSLFGSFLCLSAFLFNPDCLPPSLVSPGLSAALDSMSVVFAVSSRQINTVFAVLGVLNQFFFATSSPILHYVSARLDAYLQ